MSAQPNTVRKNDVRTTVRSKLPVVKVVVVATGVVVAELINTFCQFSSKVIGRVSVHTRAHTSSGKLPKKRNLKQS